MVSQMWINSILWEERADGMGQAIKKLSMSSSCVCMMKPEDLGGLTEEESGNTKRRIARRM